MNWFELLEHFAVVVLDVEGQEAARGSANTVSVEGLVREVLQRSPAPPRRVGYPKVLRSVFASSLGFAVVASGSVLLLAGVGFLWASRGAVIPLVLAAWFLVVGVLVWVVLFTYAGRVRLALEKGTDQRGPRREP